MSNLKRLSKLREFKAGQDPAKYLSTEFRQNLLALESALKTDSDSQLYYTVNTITIAVDAEELLTYSNTNRIDFSQVESDGILTMKSNAVYDVEFRFNQYTCVGAKSIDLKVYKGSELFETQVIIHTTQSDQFTASAFLGFPLEVSAGDKLSFKIHNYGTASSTQFSSSVLKMTKLNI